MTQEPGTIPRRQWLLKTLYAWRGHFPADGAAPVKEARAESIDIPCIDTRLDIKSQLKIRPKEAFQQGSVAAVITKFDEEHGTSDQMHVAISVPLQHFPDLRHIRVLGHTDCKGIEGLYDGLLKDAKPADDASLKWLLPMAPEGTADALKAARKGHEGDKALDETLKRKLEQIVVLRSMQNAFDYTVRNKATGTVDTVAGFADKGLHVTGAIYDLFENQKGGHDLLVYDPQQKKFHNVDDLFKEAFPGQAPSSAVIEAAMEASDRQKDALKKTFLLYPGPAGPAVVPRYATSETVAEPSMADVKEGIAVLLGDIKHMGMKR